MSKHIKTVLSVVAILIVLATIIYLIEQAFGVDLNIGRQNWGAINFPALALDLLP